MRRGKGSLTGQNLFDDFAAAWRDGDDKRGGEQNGQRFSVKTDFPFAGVANKKDRSAIDMLDTGEFILVEAISDIGDIDAYEFCDFVKFFEIGLFDIDPTARAEIIDLFELRVANGFEVDLNHDLFITE